MRIFLKPVLAVLFVIMPAGIIAQSLSTSLQQDDLLRRLINEVDSLSAIESKKNIYPENNSGSSISLVYQTLDALSFDSSSYFGPLLQEVAAEKEAAKDDFGLSFRTGYRENIEEGIFSGGDIYYLRRFNAGFQWDFLSGGWFDSHKRVEELEVREKMVERNINIQRANERYERAYNRLIYLFNLQKINVIQEYQRLVNANLELMQRLHYLDYEPWESVLELSELKARLQNDLASYQEYNKRVEQSLPDSLVQHIEVLDAAKLPLLELNIEALIAANDTAFAGESLTEKDLEKLDYNFLRDISLAAYADYNIYDGTGNALDPETIGGREYFSVGLNLSIPLPLNSSEKQKMVEERKLTYINTQRSEQYSEQKEINNIHYEYRYKTQQFIQLYKDFQSRQETIDNYKTLKDLGDSGYSVQQLVHILLQRYAVVLQMIDLKQQMYLQLINMDKYLADQSILEFATPLDVSTLFPYKTVRADGIYIWSDTFAENSNNVLLKFLKSVGVKRVYLSLGSNDSLLEKASRFITTASKENIESHLLVGNNNLIRPENQQMELQILMKQAEELGFSGIHLDVEPHTFDDWESQRTAYEQNYVLLLERASEIFSVNNLSLSVSIPHFYDSILPDINQTANEIVVMVYETQDLEVLKQRIDQESQVLGEKLNVAIRPSDFANFDDLNTFVQQIVNQTAAHAVVLHDAGSLLNIENRSR
jgi:hypothetical protein